MGHVATSIRGTGTKKLQLRLQPDLHADLLSEATQDHRSLNGEILTLLQEALTNRRRNAERSQAAVAA